MTTPTLNISDAIAWPIDLEKMQRESPAGMDLLRAAAFLAPEAIPDEFFLDGGSEISALLGEALASGDSLAVAELAAPLLRYSLVERDAEKRTVSLHPLVQEAVKKELGDAGSEIFRCVVKALLRSFPWPEHKAWPRCERLLPHLLAGIRVAEEGDEIAWLMEAGGMYLRQRARFAEAAHLYERSLAIWEKSLGADHTDVARSLNNLALLYADLGRFTEAEPLHERALAIWGKSHGGEHPHVAIALNDLALLYSRQGRFTEAEPLYERALAIRVRSLSSDHPEVASSLINLAILRRKQEREAEAEELESRARSVRPRHEARNRRS